MKKTIFLLSALVLLLAGCGTSGAQKSVPLESVAAYPEKIHLQKGDTEVIQVVFTPNNADEQALVWATSDQSVATVDEQGVVSALAPGRCTVTVASRSYSQISCHVEIIVNGKEEVESRTQDAKAPQTDSYVTYVPQTNATLVYPTYYLSEGEAGDMDQEQIQFLINQIYAKNGYVFRSQEIQNYFSQMPWYVAVSNDTSRLSMSSLDRSNLNLLIRFRDQHGGGISSELGWIWTRHVVDSPISASYVSNLSDYDIQLLINTIYAKNGYLFETKELQALFDGQPWYQGKIHEADQLPFSSIDKENLQLLVDHRS